MPVTLTFDCSRDKMPCKHYIPQAGGTCVEKGKYAGMTIFHAPL